MQRDGDEFETLDGQIRRKLDNQVLMICDAEKEVSMPRLPYPSAIDGNYSPDAAGIQKRGAEVNELLQRAWPMVLDSDLALISVAMVVNWNLIAMDFIFLSAALRAVPVSYYERRSTARDGWKVFRNITLPSVSPTLFSLP